MPTPKPVWKADEELSARKLNQTVDYCATRPASGPGIEDVRYGGGAIRAVSTRPGQWIRLTAAGAGGRYTWTRVVATPGGGWDVDDTDSGTHDGDEPAIEANGNATIPLPCIVWADRANDTSEWRFYMGECP